MKVKIEGNLEKFVSRFFYLAYKAAGKPCGMGIYQAREDATEKEVLKNISHEEDYPYRIHNTNNNNLLCADYVFGRMMKLGVKIEGDNSFSFNHIWNPDYESFCVHYTPETLLEQTAKEVNCSYTIIE